MNIEDAILVMTRPAGASERFAGRLSSVLGAPGQTIIAPVLRIEAVGTCPEVPKDCAFAFTSEAGVHAWAALSNQRGLAYCVGPRTGSAAQDHGFDVLCGNGGASDLAAIVIAKGGSAPVIHAAGRHTRGNLVETLVANGLRAARVVLYEQHAQDLSTEAKNALKSASLALLPVFSPRSAALLSAQIGGDVLPLRVAALSPAVSKACQFGPEAIIEVADAPNTQAMIDALARLVWSA